MAEFLSAITQSTIKLTVDGDAESGEVNRDVSQWAKVRDAYQMVMRIRGGVSGHAQLYINALAGDNELLRQRLVEYETYIPFSMLGDQIWAKRVQEAIGPIVAEHARNSETQQNISLEASNILQKPQ
ncbi:hypothetical protein FRC01_003954 [Tulasnella sp. 417]|nr:hypothetical protein FRC01_003954 [Tulasnella sp. 417]